MGYEIECWDPAACCVVRKPRGKTSGGSLPLKAWRRFADFSWGNDPEKMRRRLKVMVLSSLAWGTPVQLITDSAVFMPLVIFAVQVALLLLACAINWAAQIKANA